MTVLDKPRIRENGTYDPVTLSKYLDQCRRMQIPYDQIARELRVEMHRIIYAMGDGRNAFSRRARAVELITRGLSVS